MPSTLPGEGCKTRRPEENKKRRTERSYASTQPRVGPKDPGRGADRRSGRPAAGPRAEEREVPKPKFAQHSVGRGAAAGGDLRSVPRPSATRPNPGVLQPTACRAACVRCRCSAAREPREVPKGTASLARAAQLGERRLARSTALPHAPEWSVGRGASRGHDPIDRPLKPATAPLVQTSGGGWAGTPLGVQPMTFRPPAPPSRT